MRLWAVTLAGLALATGCPGNAEAATTSDPVDKFVRSLFENQWDVAKAMIHGSISQLNGTGPTVVGGPHDGLWHQRIVPGKPSVSADDLFSAIQGCQFGRVRLLSGTAESLSKVVEVFYTCYPAYNVKFIARRFVQSENVSVSDLGKDLVTLPAPAGKVN